jgi:hypothetical protein
VAGGTAGSAKPPVLLSSIVFGLPELVVPRGSPADFDGLEVTFLLRTAVNSATDSVRIGWSSTGFGYCLVAWGGETAIVGLVGIAPFPPDFSICMIECLFNVLVAALIVAEMSDSVSLPFIIHLRLNAGFWLMVDTDRMALQRCGRSPSVSVC